MESLAAYIPMDRRQAMARGEDLPDRTKGAALFADISGFTPLTEALVKEFGPRRGAEELTKHLNAVYEALIAKVHRYRGSVIGFSGDAITCWFDGDEGLKATACALTLQQVMGQFAEVETESGSTVSLAIKAVAVIGPVRRFLVGNPQIQYIDVLAGAILDRMAEAGKQAQRGEVVLDVETLARLTGKVEILEWREEIGTGKRFAVVAGLTSQIETAVGQDGILPNDILSEEQVRPWLLPPIYERLRAGQERFLAEIRPAVPLFLKFGGLDYDNDDAAGEKLDAYIRWVQNTLARYEGYLIQLTTGDKGSYLYAVFGAPLAHDDDAARAVAAAMDLQAPPSDLDFITGVQIGVSQGRMWTGAYGGPTRCTYGVLGDEVNVAARLMEEAKPGQILVSQRIADAAAKRYHFKSLNSVEVRGKKEPIPVSTVLGGQIPPRPATPFTTPLVERETELAQVEEILGSVLAGGGKIFRLEGEAGIGKSHLAAELIERALNRNFRVAVGACQSTTQGIAYHPWQQVFRALFDLPEEPFAGEAPDAWTARQVAQVEATVNDTNPDWLPRLPLLGDLLGLPIPDNETTLTFDPKSRQEALFALAVEMVQTWAHAQPLLLLIEDAHWLDEASQGLALTLGRIIADTPVLLALVHRPQDKPVLPDLCRLSYHHHLELHELTPSGVAELVTHRLQGNVSALALNLIQTQAQGNPFFTEELVAALHESGSLKQQADGTWILSETVFDTLHQANCLAKKNGQWILIPDAPLAALDLGIPDSVHGTVLSRIDRLPEPYKLTLKVASVIGPIFEFELLAQSHPGRLSREALLEQIEAMETRNLLRLERPQPQPVYTFRHHITQEVTYDTLLEEHRRGLHQAVGEALESLLPGAVERLAYHYSHSGVRDKALLYLDQAARKTQREYANEIALNYYKQALALEQRWEWLKGQVEVLHILGRREDEEATLRWLSAVPEAPVFEVAYLWGQYHEAVGEYSQAQAAIERARVACRHQADVVSEARCLAQLGLISRKQGEYERAKAWYNQALELLRGEGAYPEAETQALNGLGTIYRQQGNYDGARTCYQRALALSRTSGNRVDEAQALNNLGVTAFYQRHLAEAMSYYRQALDVRRAIGDRAGEGASLFDLGVALCECGDYSQSQEYFLEALAIQQATGNRWEEANVLNSMGILYLLLGELSTAQDYLQQGLELSRKTGDEAIQAYLLCNLGQVRRDQGDLVAAEELLTDSLALAQAQADRQLVSICLSHLSLVSLQAGRLEQALERANAALTLRREMGLRLWTTIDLTTLAQAHWLSGDMDKALDYARQALAILDECGGVGPEFPQRDYFICSQVLSAAGQDEAACTALQSACNLVMARVEKITDPDLRRSFLEKPDSREILQEYVKRQT